jgi:hypothetical protein
MLDKPPRLSPKPRFKAVRGSIWIIYALVSASVRCLIIRRGPASCDLIAADFSCILNEAGLIVKHHDSFNFWT